MSWWLSLPGTRGSRIPEADYDHLYAIASGITLPLWGRPPLPHQMQYLHDNNLRQPGEIHAAFAALPHPHAPSVSVGDFPDYAHAYKTYQDHAK